MSGVALIIPCFNHGESLERAVRSALARPGLQQLIIVDDASSDETSWAKACALAREDERIRALRLPQNQGPAAARNVGVRESRAPYLSFLDADDELIDDFFAEASELLDRQPSLAAVKTDELFFDPVKGYILPSQDPRYAAAVLSSVPGLVMRRETFKRLGGFPEDARFRGPHGGEDVAFMQALMKHFPPLGRIARPCYKVWSCNGSHVDRFLQNTRLLENDQGFEFVYLSEEQAPNGPLAMALRQYLETVEQRLAAFH